MYVSRGSLGGLCFKTNISSPTNPYMGLRSWEIAKCRVSREESESTLSFWYAVYLCDRVLTSLLPPIEPYRRFEPRELSGKEYRNHVFGLPSAT